MKIIFSFMILYIDSELLQNLTSSSLRSIWQLIESKLSIEKDENMCNWSTRPTQSHGW